MIFENNYIPLNEKCHDLLNIYFKNKYNIKYLSYDETKEFIVNNNNIDIKIIFYFYENNTCDFKLYEYFINVMNYVKNIDLKCKIFFFTFDFWVRGSIRYSEFITNIYKAQNYKVFTFAYDIEQLNKLHNFDYSKYSNNILYNNIWTCYNTSFCEINKNPIKKLFLSGQINTNYPERLKLCNIDNVYYYKYTKNDVKSDNNNYNEELNKYIACFSSSVYVESVNKKLINTHAILLKSYEILASGSLLVMPISEEIYLNKLGLENMKTCFLLDFNKNLNNQINNMLDNIELINNIRINGYNFAKNNFLSNKKFEEIDKIINS